MTIHLTERRTMNTTTMLNTLLLAFHNDEDGAGATEYIILLILIACVVIGIVKLFGETLETKFTAGNSKIETELVF